MHEPNPVVINADIWIAGTEAEGLLLQRYHLLNRPNEELALAEGGYCEHPVAIEREHCLVFGNGLLESALSAQNLAFREMRERAARRCR